MIVNLHGMGPNQHVLKLTHADKELQSEAYIYALLNTFIQEQAAKVKRKIQGLKAEVTISSPFKRAIETCIPFEQRNFYVETGSHFEQRLEGFLDFLKKLSK